MLYALDGVSPILPENGKAYVAPGAHLIGRVRLEEGASVWFSATLRGDNEWIVIGPRSNVQDNAVLHTDPGCPLTVGADCTIGHGAILHGCTIESGVLIGMGATILNRARIREGCLVGANALVTEGKDFPPRSLILGNPARVVRQLDQESSAIILRSAANYAQRAEQYRSGLNPVS